MSNKNNQINRNNRIRKTPPQIVVTKPNTPPKLKSPSKQNSSFLLSVPLERPSESRPALNYNNTKKGGIYRKTKRRSFRKTKRSSKKSKRSSKRRSFRKM